MAMLRTSIILLWAGLLCLLNVIITEAREEKEARMADVVESLVRRLEEKDNVVASLIQRVEQLEAKAIENAKTTAIEMKQYSEKLKELGGIVKEQELKIRAFESHGDNSGIDDNHDELMDTEDGLVYGEGAKDTSKKINPTETKRLFEESRIQRRQGVEEPVAFFATLQAHPTHLGIHQTVVFERVVTNVGNAYNAHGGIFIAPRSGIYVFSASLLSHTGHNIHLSYFMNGVRQSRMYVGGAGSTANYDTSSQTIVLQLSKGDDVSVVNEDSDELIAGNNYTTFAGFLLSETYATAPIIG